MWRQWLLLTGPLTGYKSCAPCQAGEGSVCRECACAIRCSVCLCVFEDDYVTRELPRWLVVVWAATPTADALILTLQGGEDFLWNIPLSSTTLTSVSCSHFPAPPQLLGCLPFCLSHLRLTSTRQCYPTEFPITPFTAAAHPWAGPPAPAQTPQTGRLPLGFLENHLPLSQQVARPSTTAAAAAAELTGSLWPSAWPPPLRMHFTLCSY